MATLAPPFLRPRNSLVTQRGKKKGGWFFFHIYNIRCCWAVRRCRAAHAPSHYAEARWGPQWSSCCCLILLLSSPKGLCTPFQRVIVGVVAAGDERVGGRTPCPWFGAFGFRGGCTFGADENGCRCAALLLLLLNGEYCVGPGPPVPEFDADDEVLCCWCCFFGHLLEDIISSCVIS